MKTYKALANAVLARNNCKKSGNKVWYSKHAGRINHIMVGAPSGSGFDVGMELDENSTSERLVFTFGYHHMDSESGMYTHWSHHDVTVTGSLVFGFKMEISDAESEGDLDYFFEVFEQWLNKEATP